jgi:hypothetical protein
MQVLSTNEVEEVSGGDGATIAFIGAGAWAGAVAGAAFGSIVPGAGTALGGLGGALFGAAVSTAIGIAQYYGTQT